jgi:hypothetical protein
MGVFDRNEGIIERADLDGRSCTTIIPEGAAHVSKQISLDIKKPQVLLVVVFQNSANFAVALRAINHYRATRKGREPWTRASLVNQYR